MIAAPSTGTQSVAVVAESESETAAAGEISIDDLRYAYASRDGEQRTILHVSHWEVSPREQVLLRGISGSGKTTLLNVLAGIAPPTTGAVWLGETSLYALNEGERDRLRAGSIGYVFQTHMLVPTLTALENTELPLIYAGERNKAKRHACAVSMLERLGLADVIARRPAQLSTGQRLRVAVARAVVASPQVILADEPTAALDTQNSVLVVDLLQELATESSATLIVASHDPTLNPRFKRIVDIKDGALVEFLHSREPIVCTN